MSSQRVNQPRRHRDTEILCVFASLWLISLCLRFLRVDYSDTLLTAIRFPADHEKIVRKNARHPARDPRRNVERGQRQAATAAVGDGNLFEPRRGSDANQV